MRAGGEPVWIDRDDVWMAPNQLGDPIEPRRIERSRGARGCCLQRIIDWPHDSADYARHRRQPREQLRASGAHGA